jgi:tetraacyldisaccharide 4'-kinase
VKLLRKILFPIVPVYQGVTWLRNYCYDNDYFSSKTYDFPIICVGNLSVGGTGKTPMIEYLIRLLQNDYLVGTLSRGYGRQTKGFIIADSQCSAETIGDEPFQFHHKYSNIIVSVDADRQNGIKQLLELDRPPNVLLLDDAFQHRKVSAGLNVLLTTYGDLYANDMVLPTGNLREPKSGAKRADVIIVTKCPDNISENEQKLITNALNIETNQNIFFSSICYSDTLISKEESINLTGLMNREFTLVTGIANPKPLVEYLSSKEYQFKHESFKDHHDFTPSEIKELDKKDFILTTEKDYARLVDKLVNAKLFYLPITTRIINHDAFNSIIKSFISKF